MSLLIWTNAEFPPAETALLEAGIAPHRLVRSPGMSAAVLAEGVAKVLGAVVRGEVGGEHDIRETDEEPAAPIDKDAVAAELKDAGAAAVGGNCSSWRRSAIATAPFQRSNCEST